MAYWEWGDPRSEQTIVCVHGLTRQGRDFDALAQALSRRARVVCPDVVGRGSSGWLSDASGYAVPFYVADMVTLLARLNAPQVDWVGTSMGGLIGMGLASLADAPIRRLVLNDVGPKLDYPALQRIGTYVGMDVSWPSFEAACEALRIISQGFGPHTPEVWAALCRHQVHQDADGRWRSRYDPAIGAAFRHLTPEWAAAGEAALWSSYDRISCPTLVIRGGESDLLSAETASRMAERGPKATVWTVEGVGHAPTLIDAQQVDRVRDFLWDD